MTRRLYYENSYLTEFAATCLDERRVGEKPAVVLDQTAFYPASGGQPCDTGWLGEARVESVEEDASGRVLHILEANPPVGKVYGRIDWERRFDHMQQHSGQHILSQAFLCVARANTLSFHLGQQTSTIDLDIGTSDPGIVRAAEELAVRIVFEDRPITILNVNREELGSLGVRKESQRGGEIRVIDIDRFDRSPCGGTHVRRCGEVGLIFVLGSERYKGGIRVEFVCGGRALMHFRKDHEVLAEIGRLYSVHPHQLAGVIEKWIIERSTLKREKEHAEHRILEMEAQELLGNADKIGGFSAVRASYGDRKVESLKALAQIITATPGTLAILWTTQEPAQVIVARGPGSAADCGAAVRLAAGRLGGKGGGRPELAQAGGIATSAVQGWSEAITDYFRTYGHDEHTLLRPTDSTGV